MIGLIPVEHWDYALRDALRGFADACHVEAFAPAIDLPDVRNCVSVRSGRAAVVLALRALRLPAGSKVAVPLFCCSVVFKAIRAADCEPCFIETDASTLCMSAADLRRKRHGVKAVIAVHTYGRICDIPSLLTAAPGVPLIEDCAQALGSRADGRPAGTFGTIGIFSFRSGKYLSVGEGAAIYTADPLLRDRVAQDNAQLPAPGRTTEFVHVAKTWLRSSLRRRPLYGMIGHRLWTLYNSRTDSVDKAAIELSRPFQTDRNMIDRRLKQLASMIATHRANAALYEQILLTPPAFLRRQPANAFYNHYLFPLIFPSQQHRDAVAHYLYKNRIDTIKHLNDITDVATSAYGYRGDCPTSELLAKSALLLPTHSALAGAEIRRIAACVNCAWREVAPADPPTARESASDQAQIAIH